MTIDDQFPINPEAEMMASRQLSNVSPESEPEYLDKMIYYNEYPQNERFVQEAHRVSHKGVPTPRMENCIQNEEVKLCI